MRLLSLEVENYRNIASASLTPGRELTVICGNNGQGKTNLLEAIWLLTGGKSFRGGKDAELVRRGEPFAVLKASTLRAQQEEQETEEPNRVRLTVGAPDSPRPGRTVSVNGGAVKRAAYNYLTEEWCLLLMATSIYMMVYISVICIGRIKMYIL